MDSLDSLDNLAPLEPSVGFPDNISVAPTAVSGTDTTSNHVDAPSSEPPSGDAPSIADFGLPKSQILKIFKTSVNYCIDYHPLWFL
jgi:hypothetical protein